MNVRCMSGFVLVAGLCLAGQGRAAAQCCLTDMFHNGFSCLHRQPRAIAVAPVAPVAAPIIAPVVMPAAPPAPPPPVMVPMQQTSYVPETTYRTEYRCVPVTSYKPSYEIDPCTGCQFECMQQMTEYVQQPVSVPVTQYRAVTTTQYIQMQPGVAAPAAGFPGVAPAAPAAASPFSGVQTAPQAWGAAGQDVAPRAAPTFAPPALPPGGQPPATITPGPSYQYYAPSAQAMQPIPPQAGTYASQQPQSQQPQYQPPQSQQPQSQQPQSQQPQSQQPQYQQPQYQQPQSQEPRSVEPPSLNPAPSLKPIPELPRTSRPDAASDAATTSGSGLRAMPESYRAPPAPAPQQGMPVLPGTGPGPATGAFPRLLAPTSHTTSWGPSDGGVARVQYPTAALPAWRNSQQ